MTPGVRAAAALLWFFTAAPSPAAAQETRAALLERQRAEKAAQLRPYEPSRIEKILLYIEDTDPVSKIAPWNGPFVRYGYTGKPVGSGIAFGGGYRHDLFDRHARMVLEGGLSIRAYQMVRADFATPYLLDERLELGVTASYHRHPQEDFFGLGPDSLKDNRTSFEHEFTDVQARAVVRPMGPLQIGVRAGRREPSIGRGTDTRYPSLQDRFGPAEVPGLAAQPSFTYTELFGELDTRDQDGNARAGTLLAASWRAYGPRGTGEKGFRRVEADAQQFFPIFDKKRVIALRAHLTATAADGGDVPFYFQPTLGGGNSLRSYPDYRFRDHHVIFLNAEYRWEAFSGLDMALFSDWGKVARRTGDIDLTGLKHAYGIGFRFNTYKTVFFRFDVAAGGGEGLRYFFKFSNVF